MIAVHTIPPSLSQQDIQRFLSRVDKTPGFGPKGDCWEWRGGKDGDGYGLFWAQGRLWRAHRIAWLLAGGTWATERPLVCHTCDHPPCVRDVHLFQGTQKMNNDDKIQKGRARYAVDRKVYCGDEHWTRRLPERVARGAQTGAFTHPEKLRRGERHWKTRLTDAVVLEIRSLRQSGVAPKALRLKYGLRVGTLDDILAGKTWKHLLN